MEKATSASEKVRPILQAMERSVESARQRRLHGREPAPSAASINWAGSVAGQNGRPASQSATRPMMVGSPDQNHSQPPAGATPGVAGQVGRPKARPKRIMPTQKSA